MNVPYGYCECGCGNKTRTARRSNAKYGHVVGQPVRFLRGHTARMANAARIARIDVDSRYVIDPASGCWVWQHTALPGSGYGVVHHDGRKTLAHRFFWERLNGPVPDGLELDHLCRNPPCCNPDHLEAVSHAENSRRGARAKVNHEIAAQIRAAEGTHVELAARFDISTRTVRQIRSGKAWMPDAFLLSRARVQELDVAAGDAA